MGHARFALLLGVFASLEARTSEAVAQEHFTTTPSVGVLTFWRDNGVDSELVYISSETPSDLMFELRLSHRMGEHTALELSYGNSSIGLGARYPALETRLSTPSRTVQVFGRSDVNIHLAKVEMAYQFMSDEPRHRSLLILAGTGVVLFDPSTNEYSTFSFGTFGSSAGQLDGDLQRELVPEFEAFIDPMISGGLAFTTPIKSVLLRINAIAHVQLCSHDDSDERSPHYLCPRSGLLPHYGATVGAVIPIN